MATFIRHNQADESQVLFSAGVRRLPNVTYVGGDIVGSVAAALQKRFGRSSTPGPSSRRSTGGLHTIKFIQLDLSKHFLWPVDLLIVRDTLRSP